jgi:arginyl-tRNA synthetase
MKEALTVEQEIKNRIKEALVSADLLSVSDVATSTVLLERPADLTHGDYSTNIALILAKNQKKNPRELAEQIAAGLRSKLLSEKSPSFIEKVEVAGAGFINFHLSGQFFADRIKDILKLKDGYGFGTILKGKKVIVEYTDPNPFKAFHIGHLMSNAIGESVARLVESQGAKVKRANYQGDVGLHVAKAIYGMLLMKTEIPSQKSDKASKISFLGNAYATGAKLYEKDDETKAKIQEINKKIYEISAGRKTDKEIDNFYKVGKEWSLEHFKDIYAILGTHFDYYFFESQVAQAGKEIVGQALEKGVFEKSDGAVVFKGEQYGLHTRVFITKDGLPTYETKEIALNKRKFDLIKPDHSIVVTANEQTEYFKVVLKAMEQIFPEVAAKTSHLSHGMLVLPTGKMSSRTGDVITGESLLMDTIKQVQEKMASSKGASSAMQSSESSAISLNNKIAKQVAVAAIKYSMLRQSPGKNIVYDVSRSLSLEGDSGPYLQYAAVRAGSVLQKAKEVKLKASAKLIPAQQTTELEKSLVRFPEIVARAAVEYMPSDVATYLINLAGTFNAFYAKEQIVSDAAEAPYRLALTVAFAQVMQNGLLLLGIETPERM